MKLSLALVGLAAALSLSACSEAPTPASEPVQRPVEATVDPSPPIGPMEGHYTDRATFPGGVHAEIVSVEIGPSDQPYIDAGEPTWVTIVTRISTVGDEAYPVGDWGPQGNLRYGPNQSAAILYVIGDSPDVELVAPGAPVDVVEHYSLPVPEADAVDLRYTFSPAAEYELPWVFLDLQETP